MILKLQKSYLVGQNSSYLFTEVDHYLARVDIWNREHLGSFGPSSMGLDLCPAIGGVKSALSVFTCVPMVSGSATNYSDDDKWHFSGNVD